MATRLGLSLCTRGSASSVLASPQPALRRPVGFGHPIYFLVTFILSSFSQLQPEQPVWVFFLFDQPAWNEGWDITWEV